MQKLIISLVVITLSAIAGIGWVIDQVFDTYSESTQSDIVVSYQVIGRQLASSIEILQDPIAFVDSWNNKNTNTLSLTNKLSFVLPATLEENFYLGEVLILESDGMLSLHYFMPMHESVLSFTPDELVLNYQQDDIRFILTMVFYSGIFLFILLWLYPLINGLRSLRKSTLNLGDGDLTQRISISRVSYIADIEMEFNRMAEKIETLISDNKLISSAVSHDLRTPLSRLRFGIDVLTETEDPQKRIKYQQHMSRDIDEMQSLVEVLLNYARLEHSFVSLSKEPVELAFVIQEVMDSFSESDVNIKYLVTATKTIVAANRPYLKMLIQNIVSNAVKYSRKNILLELETKNGNSIMCVHDDGPGVKKEQRNLIFNPFVKGPNGGFGMGLAIAERIAHWHHAKIEVLVSATLKGAVFRVVFHSNE